MGKREGRTSYRARSDCCSPVPQMTTSQRVSPRACSAIVYMERPRVLSSAVAVPEVEVGKVGGTEESKLWENISIRLSLWSQTGLDPQQVGGHKVWTGKCSARRNGLGGSTGPSGALVQKKKIVCGPRL